MLRIDGIVNGDTSKFPLNSQLEKFTFSQSKCVSVALTIRSNGKSICVIQRVRDNRIHFRQFREFIAANRCCFVWFGARCSILFWSVSFIKAHS